MERDENAEPESYVERIRSMQAAIAGGEGLSASDRAFVDEVARLAGVSPGCPEADPNAQSKFLDELAQTWMWGSRHTGAWRLIAAPADALWTLERRAQYLLREDSSPVSADPRVSPETDPGAPDAIEMKLWVLTSAGGGDADQEITPAHEPRSDGWALLGYDVCDDAMLSGLMNCGYWPAERVALALRWRSKLNDRHLFDRIEDAVAFRTETDARVPEHAPFRVVAILARAGAVPRISPGGI